MWGVLRVGIQKASFFLDLGACVLELQLAYTETAVLLI